MSSLIIPGRDPGALDSIARRMADGYAQAAQAGAVSEDEAGDPNLIRDPWQPRWRIDAQWVEFECGCRAERARPNGAVQRDGVDRSSERGAARQDPTQSKLER